MNTQKSIIVCILPVSTSSGTLDTATLSSSFSDQSCDNIQLTSIGVCVCVCVCGGGGGGADMYSYMCTTVKNIRLLVHREVRSPTTGNKPTLCLKFMFNKGKWQCM